MYVCICNAVTEKDVRGCMANGACATVKDVKAACGMKPGCGSCTRRLSTLVGEYRPADAPADARTGGPFPPAPTAEPAAGPAEPAAGPEWLVPEQAEPMMPEPLLTEHVERRTAPPTAA